MPDNGLAFESRRLRVRCGDCYWHFRFPLRWMGQPEPPLVGLNVAVCAAIEAVCAARLSVFGPLVAFGVAATRRVAAVVVFVV